MEEIKLNWSSLRALNSENVNALDSNLQGPFRLSYKEDGDDNYYVFYVAESEDIKKILSEIVSNNFDNACVSIKYAQKKCAFRYAISEVLEIRQAATKQAYLHYQPSCNLAEPIGRDDIIINLS